MSMLKTYLSGKSCPNCDCKFVFCYLCDELAIIEGWYGSGLIRKVPMCEEHQRLLRGYKEEESE